MTLVRFFVLLALVIVCSTVSGSCFEITVNPNGPADMGEGPAVETDLYIPGGLPDVLGLSVGQPNTLTRNDRVLVRFDISHLALKKNIAARLLKAELSFDIDANYFRDVPTQLEVVRLLHDTAGGFVGTDLVREPNMLVGIVRITDRKPPRTKLDVTKAVRSDLEKGRKFTSYRWRNITAESKGNTFLDAWFVRVMSEPQHLPALKLTFKDEVPKK